MSKYEAFYFVGDNQAINRVRVDSSKTRNRGAFSGWLAALLIIIKKYLSKTPQTANKYKIFGFHIQFNQLTNQSISQIINQEN